MQGTNYPDTVHPSVEHRVDVCRGSLPSHSGRRLHLQLPPAPQDVLRHRMGWAFIQ